MMDDDSFDGYDAVHQDMMDDDSFDGYDAVPIADADFLVSYDDTIETSNITAKKSSTKAGKKRRLMRKRRRI